MSKSVKDKTAGSTVLRLIFVYVFALVFPLLAKFIFLSHLSIVLIIILVIIKPTLAILGEFVTEIKRACIILSSIFSFIFAFLITIGILITPANAYMILFNAMQANMLNPGRVSNLFVLFIAFFSTSFSCSIITKDFTGPFLGMALIISLLSALIFQSPIIYIVSVIFIVFCLAYIARKYLDKGNRIGNILLSVIIIAICLVIGFFLHRFFRIHRSKAIDKLSTSLRGVVSIFFPQIPLMYELPEFGFAFDDEFKNDLGSTPVLSNIPLFEVKGIPDERIIYLRTRIHDRFSNNNWETPSYNLYIEEKKKKKNLTGIEPDKKEDEVIIPTFDWSKSKTENEIELRLFGEYFNLLPQTLDTVGFRFTRSPPKVVYGDPDKGYYLDDVNMLLSGDTVYLRKGEKEIIKPDSFAPYLQVPLQLSSEIIRMARMYESISDPHTKINRIKNDLASGYTYNIETGDIPENENFLDTFIKTKQGYSVHFATALIMLARLNHIPARYATGFLAIIPQIPDGEMFFNIHKTTISGYSAHVWPEVWYDDTGWTTEEATPAVNPDFYTITDNGIIFHKKITLNSRTQQQISALMGQTVIYGEEPEGISFKIPVNLLYLLYALIPVVCILFWIRYAYVFIYLFRKNRKTVNMLLKKVIKKQWKKGIPAPNEIGWCEWGCFIQKHSPKFVSLTGKCIRIILNIMYGGNKVEKGDVKAIFALYRKVHIKKIKTDNI